MLVACDNTHWESKTLVLQLLNKRDMMKPLAKEVWRIVLFLLIIYFYLSSKIGLTIGVIHLLLALRFPELRMSRLLIRILDRKKRVIRASTVAAKSIEFR